MSNCKKCGKTLSWPTYTCKFCGEKFCSKSCQMPEEHDCYFLKLVKELTRKGFVLKAEEISKLGKILTENPELKNDIPKLKELMNTD